MCTYNLSPKIQQAHAKKKLFSRAMKVDAKPCLPSNISGRPGGTSHNAFLVMGCVSLLTYYFFMQSLPFFEARLYESFAGVATIAYGISANVGQLLGLWMAPKVSMNARIFTSTGGLALVAGMYIMVSVFGDTWRIPGVFVTILLGFNNAIFQSAASGLASCAGSDSLRYFYLGQSVCGLLPLPMMLVADWAGNLIGVPDEGYLAQPGAIGAISGMVFAFLGTLAFIPYMYFAVSRNMAGALEGMIQRDLQSPTFLTVCIRILPVTLPLWLLFAVTFTVYPQELVKWDSESPLFVSALIFRNLLIYLATVFDILGNYLPLLLGSPNIPIWLFQIGSVFRIAFIPCVVFGGKACSDLVKILLVASLASSGGYLLSEGLSILPGVAQDESAEMSGYIASFFLTNGITAGGLAGYFIDLLV